jgi:hypothetical protein
MWKMLMLSYLSMDWICVKDAANQGIDLPIHQNINPADLNRLNDLLLEALQ